MRWSKITLLIVAFAGCSKAKDSCTRLAPRIMPEPRREFIDACTKRYDEDPELARMVECLLDVEGDVWDKDIERCGGRWRLPMYFQF